MGIVVVRKCKECGAKGPWDESCTCSERCLVAAKEKQAQVEHFRKNRDPLKEEAKARERVNEYYRALLKKAECIKKTKVRVQLNRLICRQIKSPSVARKEVIERLLATHHVLRPTPPHVEINKAVIKADRIRNYKGGSDFLASRAWQDLRYKALKYYGRKCMCCHTTEGEMHVDHIKPRSLYPLFALDFDNLQILCRACNMGKSNTDETDWRPSIKPPK